MDDQLALDIIEIKKNWLVLAGRYGWIVGVIAVGITILLDNRIATMSLVGIALLLSILGGVIEDRQYITGQISLGLAFIRIKTKDSNLTLPLSLIEGIKIRYCGYDGKPPSVFSSSIILSKGLDNYIAISTSENRFIYKVRLLESDLIPFNNLVQLWKENGRKVSVVNGLGIKIKRLTI